jgi:Family of unknown function (DUF6084)
LLEVWKVPNLGFKVDDAQAVPFAATPTLSFKVRLTNADPEEPIHSVALRCQIQIETARRNYAAEEQSRLRDLFGEPERWGQTLRPMVWTHASSIVPPFKRETVADLPVSCTFDFNVAATKYFAGLADGEVPLCLMFSGTIFYEAENGLLQVAQIPWDRDVNYRLPVRVWREMIDLYYPNTAWLCLRRDVFDRLNEYKTRLGIPTWEQALEELLSTVDESQIEERVH